MNSKCCEGVTAKGTQCKLSAKNGNYCSKHKSSNNEVLSTFTLTFGDQAENHAGMKKIGIMAEEGFNLDDLEGAMLWFTQNGIEATNRYMISMSLSVMNIQMQNKHIY